MLGGRMGGWEWVFLLAIVLLLFGARRLPDLARSVGRSMKIFRSEVKDLRSDDTPAAGSTAPPTSVPPGAAPAVPPSPTPIVPPGAAPAKVNHTRDDSEPLGS